MSFLISIVKIFLHAALLTVDYENLLNLVVQSSTSPFRNDRKKAQEDPARGAKLDQLVTQSLAEKPNRAQPQSYGKESDAGNTSGTGTPKFGSDQGGGGAKTPTSEKPTGADK